MEKYDIIIVGAGLAGTTAANILSRENLNILLVEQKKIGIGPRSKIDVAEVKNLEKYVKKLGIKPNCITYNSKWYSPSNDLFLLEFKKPDSYFFRRGSRKDSIDSQMVKESTKRGIKAVFDTKVINIKKRKKDVIVTLDSPKCKKKIASKIVIGADGINSKVAKICGMLENKTIRRVEGYGVEGTHFRNVEPTIPEVFLNSKYAPGGYLYVAPALDETTTVFCLVDKDRLNGVSVEEHFNSFIRKNLILKEKISNVKILNKIYGTGIISGPLKTTVKDNVMLIGNAARVMDPFFAYGVKNAIITACLASETAVQAISRNDTSILIKYENLWRNKLSDSIKTGFFLRNIFDSLTNSDFEYLINVLNKMKSRGLDFDELFDNFSIKKHSLPIIKSSLINPYKTLKLTSLGLLSLLKNKPAKI